MVCMLVLFFGEGNLPAGDIGWDANQRTVAVSSMATNATVVFWATNRSTRSISIVRVKPSCGYTIGKTRLPATLAPGQAYAIRLDTDVRGKRGILNKSAQVFSSSGVQVLKFKLAIGLEEQALSRQGNRVLAEADRQAVFRGKCADCHAKRTEGKSGKPLFAAACGICHEAEHRASMVPDISAHRWSRQQWKTLIAKGKPNSLMPAFHQEQHGPLSPAQIESLAELLSVDSQARPSSASDSTADDSR